MSKAELVVPEHKDLIIRAEVNKLPKSESWFLGSLFWDYYVFLIILSLLFMPYNSFIIPYSFLICSLLFLIVSKYSKNIRIKQILI